jgi:hypothetical protein
MEPTANDILKQELETLPEEIRQFIGGNFPHAIDTIVIKYALTDAQEESLWTETLILIVGLSSPQEYAENLVREAGFSVSLSGSIMQDVFELLLKPMAALGGRESQPGTRTGIEKSLRTETPHTLLPGQEPLPRPQQGSFSPMREKPSQSVPQSNAAPQPISQPTQARAEEPVPSPRPTSPLRPQVPPLQRPPVAPSELASRPTAPPQAPQQGAPQTPAEPQKKFFVDPYREPAE